MIYLLMGIDYPEIKSLAMNHVCDRVFVYLCVVGRHQAEATRIISLLKLSVSMLNR